MTKREKALDKIKKLLNLQNHQNTSPEEAAVAAEMAYKIMEQYNVSLSEVEGYDPRDAGNYRKVEIDLNSEEITPVEALTGTLTNWRRQLIYALCRTHYCDAVQYRPWRKKGNDLRVVRMDLVGEEHNLEMVLYLYKYLAGQLSAMERPYWSNHRGPESRVEFQDGFYKGAVLTIYNRLNRLKAEERRRQEVDAKTGSGTALIVLKGEALQKAMDDYFPNVKSERAPTAKSFGAFAAGMKAGKDVALNKPIEGGSGGGRLTG